MPLSFAVIRVCPIAVSRGKRRRWLRGVLAAVSMLGAAFAHDPMEITADAVLRPGSLELKVTMARSTAFALANDTKFGQAFDPATFAALRPRFEQRAAGLYAITSAGTALVPSRADVALTVENDVEFRLVYPRAAPGPLRFEAVHVAKLGDGYGDLLTIQGEHGELLGQKTLMGTDLVLEAIVPAAPLSPASPSSAVSPPQPFRLGLAVLSALLVAVLFFWLRRRPPVVR